jgi:hypothetical protein
MSLESTTTIAGLVTANPTAGDPFSQGDDHFRLLKTVLKTIFPGAGGTGFSTAITATEAELNFVHGVTSAIQSQFTAVAASLVARVPAGIICIWHGYLNLIPAGWVLCDGANYTPDLTGKVVIGYDPVSFPVVYATGGYADAAVITHTHVATASLSTSTDSHYHTGTTATESVAHTHQYGTAIPGGTGATGTAGAQYSTQNTSAESAAHTHAFTTSTDGHSHTVSGTITNAAPAGAVAVTGRNLPPYMVLCYIMKT